MHMNVGVSSSTPFAKRSTGVMRPPKARCSTRASELVPFRRWARAAFSRVADADARLAEISTAWDQQLSKVSDVEVRAMLFRLREGLTDYELVVSLVSLSIFVKFHPSRFGSQLVVYRSLLRAMFATFLNDDSEGRAAAASVVASYGSAAVVEQTCLVLTEIGGQLANEVLTKALS